jgi:hypothetical protein
MPQQLSTGALGEENNKIFEMRNLKSLQKLASRAFLLNHANLLLYASLSLRLFRSPIVAHTLIPGPFQSEPTSTQIKHEIISVSVTNFHHRLPDRRVHRSL